MTPPPEKPPLSLEELLDLWSTDWENYALHEEMAARLRAVAEEHGKVHDVPSMRRGSMRACPLCRALAGER